MGPRVRGLHLLICTKEGKTVTDLFVHFAAMCLFPINIVINTGKTLTLTVHKPSYVSVSMQFICMLDILCLLFMGQTNEQITN